MMTPSSDAGRTVTVRIIRVNPCETKTGLCYRITYRASGSVVTERTWTYHALTATACERARLTDQPIVLTLGHGTVDPPLLSAEFPEAIEAQTARIAIELEAWKAAHPNGAA